jgi:hypothetical protein
MCGDGQRVVVVVVKSKQGGEQQRHEMNDRRSRDSDDARIRSKPILTFASEFTRA